MLLLLAQSVAIDSCTQRLWRETHASWRPTRPPLHLPSSADGCCHQGGMWDPKSPRWLEQMQRLWQPLQGCVLAECDAESFWALSRRPSSGFCPWQGSEPRPLSLLSSNFLTAGGSAEQREAALRSCLSEGAHRNASAFASYK